jgi:GNAT superfamily N-acetyltransferase
VRIDLSRFNCHVDLRAARAEDEAFLLQVYASTRTDEMALVPWTEEQKAAFLLFQFEAQRSHYQNYYLAAQTWIILREGIPIGRMIVDDSGPEILLMDVALLPAYRRAGIGTCLLRALQDYAVQISHPIRLHVEFFNPALHLYDRMGFVPKGQSGISIEMIWSG